MSAFEPRIFFIEGTRLAVMPRPVSGEWIEDEFANIAKIGVNVVVSLLEPEEAEELGLGDEAELCEQNGIKLISFPIQDRCLPKSLNEFCDLIETIDEILNDGETVAVHCRAGIGRSGIVAAAILIRSGLEVAEAFTKVSAARGMEVPDTNEQRHWIESNADRFSSC
ncbi:MAG: dual specificity protein phosphatase family protein [Verrucomicrobiota bacterium]